MKTVEVTVSYGITVQPVKFESIRCDMAATVTLDDDEDPIKVRADLKKQLKAQIRAAIAKDIEQW